MRQREDLLAIFENLLEPHEDVHLKGKQMPYVAMNGNMFAFLAPEGMLCLRLSDSDRETFAAEFGDAPVVQYGSVMRGYVALPDTLLDDAGAWFDRSVAFARTLKPKPTKR